MTAARAAGAVFGGPLVGGAQEAGAPQGYQKAPQWQQEIIEKVVKGMASRQKDTRGVKQSGLSKEQMARTKHD